MEGIIIFVEISEDEDISFGSSISAKVSQVKKRAFGDVAADEFRLTYKGDTLDDHQTLDHYVIEDEEILYLQVARKPPSAEMEPTPPSDTTTGDLASPDKKIMLFYHVMSQMMQTLLYSPTLVNQMFDQTQTLDVSIHSRFSKMMKNPEVVGVFRRLTSPWMMQQMISTPFHPEIHQYPKGVLPPGATPVPLEQLFEAQLKHLQETRDPDT